MAVIGHEEERARTVILNPKRPLVARGLYDRFRERLGIGLMTEIAGALLIGGSRQERSSGCWAGSGLSG